MKKRVLIFALLLAGISYSFADTTDGISKKAVASFNRNFSDAKNIRWERMHIFVKATFTLDNAIMFAYYSTDGELMAVTRNILSDQLPIAQLLSLKKNYKDYWISGLIEVDFNGDKAYYATIETGSFKLVLESMNAGDWQVYSKKEKE